MKSERQFKGQKSNNESKFPSTVSGGKTCHYSSDINCFPIHFSFFFSRKF